MSDVPAPEPKFSKEEFLKEGSHQLRGTIAQELAEGTDNFVEDNAKLLKHHGTYQQDDKDHRKDKNADGTRKGKAYMFMVRTRIPGGKVTANQLLAELDLCDRYGNGTLRITSRQGLQLHGVLKEDLRETIRGINHTMLTTLAACGDVERNVMCCPAPYAGNPVRREMQEMADRVAEHLKPRTTAYYEIWLKDDEGQRNRRDRVQAGRRADLRSPLPAAQIQNGLRAARGQLRRDLCQRSGFFGDRRERPHRRLQRAGRRRHGGDAERPQNVSCCGQAAGLRSRRSKCVGVAEAIVKVQRDFGNREDRKVARLKYLIANWGIPAFKAKVEEYFGHSPRRTPSRRRDRRRRSHRLARAGGRQAVSGSQRRERPHQGRRRLPHQVGRPPDPGKVRRPLPA